MTISRRSFLILPLTVALPARARAANAPFTDAMGRRVTLPGTPERIAIVFNFEEFTAVGGPSAWDRVVGFDHLQWRKNRAANYRRYEAVIPRLETLADTGDTERGTFSVEKVLSLKPDLLITLAAGYRGRAALMQQIEAAGVPILVLDYNAQEVDKHVASTLALGRATGQEERAQTLAELYRTKVADIQRRVAQSDRPKAYIELGYGGAAEIGNSYNGAMWGRMVETAGSTNIATGHIPIGWAPLAPEYVLAAAPEHIFITGSSWADAPNSVRAGYDTDIETTRRTLAPYAQRPGWSVLPAIRDGNLYAVETGLARSLWDYTAMLYMGQQVHPKAFADVDPIAELRRYHEQFLPITFEGTWMARLTPRQA